MKMRSDGSHMTEQILQLTLEIIYLLTGEDYVVVNKKSGDYVTSNQCPIEELHPSSLLCKKNNRKVLEVINQITELMTGEVGDDDDDDDLCDGTPSSLDCSEARLLSTDASDGFVAQCTKNVDKKRLSIECKSQNNTMVEEDRKGDCRVSSLTNKQIDAVGTQRRDDLNTRQGVRSTATKGTQTEKQSTYILVYNTNTLNSQAPVTKIDTVVLDKKLANSSGRRTTRMNSSEVPKNVTVSSIDQQKDRQNELTCVESGKIFSCKSHLTKHQRMHKEKLCNSSKAFSSIADLDGHQADRQDKMSWIDCSNIYTYESHIPSLQKTHNNEKACVSPDSIKTFGCTSNLADCEVHIQDHEAGNYHDGKDQTDNLEGCFDCGKNGCSSGFGRHRLINQDKGVACLDCGRNFSYKSHLVSQQKIHSGEKLFLCSECGKRFSLKSALLRHQMIHTGERPFACIICGKRFNQRSHYIRHQLSHSGKKPFACSDCGKSFIQKSDLMKHQKGHKGKKLSCPVCWKEFCSKMFLVRHQKSHGESNRAICSECGKCFSQKSALVVHQMIHTGEKPFSCDECGKLFNRKSLLVRHQRIHTGEKPFSCPECGKSFTRTTNLVIHQRTHSGEKPYSCPKCFKSFNSNATLLKHQRTHGEVSEIS